MDLDLKGKAALVTGASQGIGRAIAKSLAAEGVRLCIVARRKNLLDELAAEIVASGGEKPAIVVADALDDGAPVRIATAAETALGRIDILANSAGGSHRLTLESSAEDWLRGLTLNFIRVRELTHAVIPGMIARNWGRVITITGKSESYYLNDASAAKAALHAWSKDLSREVGRHGITVNSIAPGRIMSEQIRKNYPEAERADFAAREIPAGRFGEPEELANVATFLASPLASYVSGAVIPVDGGLRRYMF